jgi:hypothetical protein
MKRIMYRYSSEHNDGVASFTYIPVTNRQLSFLALYSRPLDELGDDLCRCFAGRTMTVEDLHNQHHINTPFVLPNYQEALRRLEDSGRIICNPSNRQIRKGQKTMANHVRITFPR